MAYTTILHPVDGRELQIKTGDDDLDVYHVGDTVKWKASKTWAGMGGLLDGVYESYSDRGLDDWVVIKEHKVVAVEPRVWHDPEEGISNYGDVCAKHGNPAPARELWSEELWQKLDEWRAEQDREFEAWKKEVGFDQMPPARRYGALSGRFFSRYWNYVELGRKLISVQPLPPGASLIPPSTPPTI